VIAALRLELRRMRGLIGWTAVVAIAYGGIVAAIYPTFRDNDQMIKDYMALFPKGILAAFGMVGSLSDPGVLMNTYITSMLWPIVAAVAGIALATRPVAGDLERGFLELPLSTRLSRVRYLGIAILGQAGAMAFLALATVGGVLVVGRLVGAPFDIGRFLLAGLHAFAFGISIAAVTTLLAVVILDRGRAAGIAAGVVIAMYLADAVAKAQVDIGPVVELSAFHHFQTLGIIDEGTFPAGDFVLFVAVSACAWGAALLAFRRRDLAA